MDEQTQRSNHNIFGPRYASPGEDDAPANDFVPPKCATVGDSGGDPAFVLVFFPFAFLPAVETELELVSAGASWSESFGFASRAPPPFVFPSLPFDRGSLTSWFLRAALRSARSSGVRRKDESVDISVRVQPRIHYSRLVPLICLTLDE